MTTSESIVIKPLEIMEAHVTIDSIVYLYSHDESGLHRTEYLSIYSLGYVPTKMMVAEQFYDDYKMNDENTSFDADVIFAVSYIIPEPVIGLFVSYNIICALLFVVAIVVSAVITYRVLATNN
jgi:hypothetical protein